MRNTDFGRPIYCYRLDFGKFQTPIKLEMALEMKIENKKNCFIKTFFLFGDVSDFISIIRC